MALFRYQALSIEGKKQTGIIDANSLEMAKERLRKEKILMIQIREVDGSSKQTVLSPPMLLAFTRELGQLLQAGLPLYESLLTIEEKYRRHPSHSLFLDLCDRLKGGASLSTILARYPKTFDPIYLAMMQSAEEAGALGKIFQQLADLLAKREKLRKRLVSAIAYPAFLGGFALVIVLALLIFVIPSMRELFEGRALHPMTSLVLGVSRCVCRYGVWMVGGLSLMVFSLIALFRDPKRRKQWDIFLLKLPLIKTIREQAALARFCLTNSLLLEGGIPLLTALSLSRQTMKHPPLEESIAIAQQGIIEGHKLSEPLKKEGKTPKLFVRMLSIGEETGKIGSVFLSLAEIYDDELDRNLSHLTAYLQPGLLLLLGLIVGFVLLAVLLPMTDVGSFIT